MPTHQIAVIGGDGIGPEVTEQAIKVCDAAVFTTGEAVMHWERLPWGSNYYLERKQMMPEDGLKQLRQFDGILLGAIGHPSVSDDVTLNGLLLPIRREFDQYVNYRPSYLFEGVTSPLSGKKPGDIDLVVFRENTEGEYADFGGRLYNQTDYEVAVQSSVFTRRGTERIIRAAFRCAAKRRKHVTSITKSNAQRYSMVFWDDVFQEVATDYPEVQSRSLLVDAAAMEMVRKPESFDVIVASNLFGDILTDLAAQVTGSIGLAASANLNPAKTTPSMFEPVHGSAPDIAGKGIANPLGAVLAAAMLLEHLELNTSAKLLRAAVRELLKNHQVLPADLGGNAKTHQVGEQLLELLRRA